MNDELNIQLQETFNQFQNKLDFELSYQDYQKILLLMKKENLVSINDYIKNYIYYNINNNYKMYSIYISYIKMILSYYSDIYLKTNIQNYNFCLEIIKQNGYTLQYLLEQYKDNYQINLEAVKQNSNSLQYVSNNLLNNKNYIIDCIKVNSKCYDYIPDKFNNNIEILKLIENNENKNISKKNQK